jgi:queuosine precursor transporter
MQKLSHRFLIVVALFITCLLTANIIIVKQISAGPFILPAAIIIFPISYIISDILTEVYGYSVARRVIWLGFICNVIMVAGIWIAGLLPSANTFTAQSAYNQILGNTPRFLLASFLAYLAGEFSNSYVLSKMKIATKGKWLWSRTIGSTVVGQAIDTVIVLSIGFVGVLPVSTLLIMILSHWFIKVSYEIIATPVTYLAVNYLKKKEGMDVYDYATNFNPVHIE